ncbi:chromosome segregation and condensation protein ScpA [mine drainage metagenome]|uniref:Chromosome segregation and condensation protein ScpA n=2 Tax=mine drainage metagenome TaxID=410659 RepID=T0YZ21_9ZZZZ
MATGVKLAEESKPKGLDLQKFVQNATWRELLSELVERKELDPWDIDITKVVEAYMEVIKDMKVLDLRVPANIVLAAAILLRMKSDTLSIFDAYQDESQTDGQDMQMRPQLSPDQTSGLSPKLRIQPRRRITLQELMDALDSALKMEVARAASRQSDNYTLQKIVIREDDIDKKMAEVLRILGGNTDRKGFAAFSNISKGFGDAERVILDLFMPLLFLAQNGEVVLLQEEFFDEIFIKLADGHDGKG